MKYMIMVLCMGLFTLRVFSVNLPKPSAYEKKLDKMEAAVAQADKYTSYCQQSTSWQFPAKLYRYIESARVCYQQGNKRNLKRANQYIQLLGIAIDQAIEGQEGYWSGYTADVWIDPVPPVPDCALQEFMELKDEITTMLSSSSDEMLMANQESSPLLQPSQHSPDKETR